MSDRTDKNLAHLLSIDISHFPTAKLHQHDEAQLSYIQKGVLKVIVAHKVYIVPAGFAIYIPPKITHGIECGQDIDGIMLYFDQSMPLLPTAVTISKADELIKQLILKIHHARSYALAKEAITNTTQQFSWIINAHGMHEQVMLHLNFGKTQKHIADRIIIDNDQYHIIDYKFATPVSNESLEEFVSTQTATYRAQLINYQKLIARYFRINPSAIKLSLYFPLVPHLQAL